MSHVMRKPTFYICENKDADQLRGNREADQRLCFRYIDSTIPLLPKYEISNFCSCKAWSVPGQVENQNVGFLTTRLIYYQARPRDERLSHFSIVSVIEYPFVINCYTLLKIFKGTPYYFSVYRGVKHPPSLTPI